MIRTKLYIYCKKGAVLKPGTLVPKFADEAHYISVGDSGDAAGVIYATDAECRKLLIADPLITVLPPNHRPLTADHAEAFGHVKAKEGEHVYDVAERLHEHHKMPWFHPEN